MRGRFVEEVAWLCCFPVCDLVFTGLVSRWRFFRASAGDGITGASSGIRGEAVVSFLLVGGGLVGGAGFTWSRCRMSASVGESGDICSTAVWVLPGVCGAPENKPENIGSEVWRVPEYIGLGSENIFGDIVGTADVLLVGSFSVGPVGFFDEWVVFCFENVVRPENCALREVPGLVLGFFCLVVNGLGESG